MDTAGWIALLLLGWLAGGVGTVGVAWRAYAALTATHARELAALQRQIDRLHADYTARAAEIRADRDAAIRYAQDQEAKWQANFLRTVAIVDRSQTTAAQVVQASAAVVDLVNQAGSAGTGPLHWRALFPMLAQSDLLAILLTRLDRLGSDEGRSLLLSGLPDGFVGGLRRADTPQQDLTAILEGAAVYDLALLGDVLRNATEVVGATSQAGVALRAWRERWHL